MWTSWCSTCSWLGAQRNIKLVVARYVFNWGCVCMWQQGYTILYYSTLDVADINQLITESSDWSTFCVYNVRLGVTACQLPWAPVDDADNDHEWQCRESNARQNHERYVVVACHVIHEPYTHTHAHAHARTHTRTHTLNKSYQLATYSQMLTLTLFDSWILEF